VATDVILPILGESISEAVIARWLKQPGDAVKRGEEIAEVESEKATLALESPANGVVLKILAGEGQRVKTNELLAIIGKPGEIIETPETLPAADIHLTPPSANLPAPEAVQPDREKRISPAARRRAEELGVDINHVSPAVAGGRVVSDDVDRFAASRSQELVSGPACHFEELNEIRRTLARRMGESAQNIPQFNVTMDVSMEAFLQALDALRPQMEASGLKLSVTGLLSYLLGQTLLKHAWLNARYNEGQVQVFETINLALAVATPQGLAAPVIYGLEKLSLVEIARRIREISRRAETNTLTMNDISNATFTLSNLGMYGVTQFVPLVNPPQAAILGVSTVRPVFVPLSGGGIALQKTLTLTVSADHRLLDGAAVADFLASLRSTIENCLASQVKLD
jgi:pyruvate dehydrogenase E2 component (dihydrolipoamide acetyltransferase)